MTACVARLRIYPFKSLDGVDVDAAALTPRGGLRLDRAFAFVDPSGGFVNGKSEPRIHRLRVSFDGALTTATFRDRGGDGSYVFALEGGDLDELASWAGAVFGRRVAVRRDDDGGFPDDMQAPGPTIVSTATIATVASWFADLDPDSVRRRLRSNIEVSGVPAFWEDSLFGAAGEAIPFCVGDVTLEATNPCARCVVPSRDPDTGVPLLAFAKRIAERRAATLPEWAERSRFDHFYRLAVNTCAAAGERAGVVRVGDVVRAPLAQPAAGALDR